MAIGTLWWPLSHFFGQMATMATSCLQCPCCKRQNFKTMRGLTQHQTQNQRCKELALRKLGTPKSRTVPHASLPCSTLYRANNVFFLTCFDCSAVPSSFNFRQFQRQSSQFEHRLKTSTSYVLWKGEQINNKNKQQLHFKQGIWKEQPPANSNQRRFRELRFRRYAQRQVLA